MEFGGLGLFTMAEFLNEGGAEFRVSPGINTSLFLQKEENATYPTIWLLLETAGAILSLGNRLGLLR